MQRVNTLILSCLLLLLLPGCASFILGAVAGGAAGYTVGVSRYGPYNNPPAGTRPTASTTPAPQRSVTQSAAPVINTTQSSQVRAATTGTAAPQQIVPQQIAPQSSISQQAPQQYVQQYQQSYQGQQPYAQTQQAQAAVPAQIPDFGTNPAYAPAAGQPSTAYQQPQSYYIIPPGYAGNYAPVTAPPASASVAVPTAPVQAPVLAVPAPASVPAPAAAAPAMPALVAPAPVQQAIPAAPVETVPVTPPAPAATATPAPQATAPIMPGGDPAADAVDVETLAPQTFSLETTPPTVDETNPTGEMQSSGIESYQEPAYAEDYVQDGMPTLPPLPPKF